MKTLILKDKTLGLQYVTIIDEKSFGTSITPTLLSDTATMDGLEKLYPTIDWSEVEMIDVYITREQPDGPTQDQFNAITDLRSFHLLHPDAEMVNRSCIHTLGDNVEKFMNSSLQSIWYAKEIFGSIQKALEWYAQPIKPQEKSPINMTNEEVINILNKIQSSRKFD